MQWRDENGIWQDWIKVESSTYSNIIPKPVTSPITSVGAVSSIGSMGGNGMGANDYNAFDSSGRYCQGGYVVFTFNDLTLVNKIRCDLGNTGYSTTGYIQISPDGTNWSTVKTVPISAPFKTVDCDINTVIKAFRVGGGSAGAYGVGIKNLAALKAD